MLKIVIGREICIGRWSWIEERREQKIIETKVCPICTSEIHEGMLTMKCPHCGVIGHFSCFDNWLKIRNACPICKRPILEVMV